MSRSRAKRLPRLWCALQGLLPLEACLVAQRGELAWPGEPVVPAGGLRRSAVGKRLSSCRSEKNTRDLVP